MLGLHQDSILSPLLFNIKLEALSREIRSGCLEELLHADENASDFVKAPTVSLFWKSSLLKISIGSSMTNFINKES